MLLILGFLEFTIKNSKKAFQNYGKYCLPTFEKEGTKGKQKYFYYMWDDKEVDFLIYDGKIKQLIQVCYEINEDDFKREINNLIEASKMLKCKNLLVVSWDQEEEIVKNGRKIKVVPRYKFLLKY